jgi:hypothetical protein
MGHELTDAHPRRKKRRQHGKQREHDSQHRQELSAAGGPGSTPTAPVPPTPTPFTGLDANADPVIPRVRGGPNHENSQSSRAPSSGVGRQVAA